MGLVDELPNEFVRPSLVKTLFETLDANDASVFKEWICDLSVSASRLSIAMTKNGTPISASTIRSWRQNNVVS